MQERLAALICPGQGLSSQEIVAYYQKLLALDPILTRNRIGLAQEAINRIQGTVNFNITADLEDEAAPSFTRTAFVQPVVYALSVLASEIMANGSTSLAPRFVAGHSLGEYAALTYSQVFSFEQGIDIVTLRGQAMQTACDIITSKLVSINGLSEEQVKDICKQTGTEIALLNAPNLIVVGGASETVPDIEKLAKEAGARKVTTLPTAGAFHTRFMKEAAFCLDQFLTVYEFQNPQIPVIANLTGQESNSAGALRNHLVESMVNPVRWVDVIQTMKNRGVQIFIESGPGKSLAQLNRLNGLSEDQTINILELTAV